MTNELVRTSTWENMGTDVMGSKKISEVLRSADLDYVVKKQKLRTSTGILVPNAAATVRGTDNHVYGVVSSSYEICQNSEAFEFLEYIDDNIEYLRAGETKGGLVYIIGRLEEVNILGDTFQPHIIFQNGHNGGYSLRASICPLRIVCQNQFNIAFKDSKNTITIQHTSNMKDRMKMASETLRSASDYLDDLRRKAERFATVKVSESDLEGILADLFPVTDDSSSRRVNAVNEAVSRFTSAYKSDDNTNFRGTAWGVINAYTDYITHKPITRKSENSEENKFTYVTLNPAYMNAFLQIMSNRVGIVR